MKIGFVTSQKANEAFEGLFISMIKHLQNKKHEVVHMFDVRHETLKGMPQDKKEEFFQKFLINLRHVDMLIAECTYPSSEVGFYISAFVTNEKPIIILSQGEKIDREHGLPELVSVKDYVGCFVYSKEDGHKVLDDALSMMRGKLEKRFTIIFPAHKLYLLEKLSRRYHVPKAVYIRQLLEKNLLEEHLH